MTKSITRNANQTTTKRTTTQGKVAEKLTSLCVSESTITQVFSERQDNSNTTTTTTLPTKQKQPTTTTSKTNKDKLNSEEEATSEIKQSKQPENKTNTITRARTKCNKKSLCHDFSYLILWGRFPPPTPPLFSLSLNLFLCCYLHMVLRLFILFLL